MKALGFTNKKTIAALATAGVVTAILVPVSFLPRSANGSFDLDGLNQQVQRQEEQLNNHEARISNTEKDVDALQKNTGTAPAEGKTSVPGVTTPPAQQSSPTPAAASPTPPATPVAPYVVSSTRNAGKDWCDPTAGHLFWIDTYSDGTTKEREVLTGGCSKP